ncbi:MAG: Crp/Fnr family transcriptional regulator [Ruthenibacterium sp.]
MEEGIARCALFAGMRAEEVEGLLGRLACTRRQYEKGEVLLHAGYENRSIGVVLYGEIEAMKLAADGTQFLTARMGPGGVFGDVLAGSRSTKSPVTVAAASRAGALWMPFSALVGCGQARLLQNYIALISDKYFSLDRRVELLLRRGVREKLFYYLKTEATPAPGGGRRTPFTRAALASYLGCERSALCREIGRLRREGLLRTQGRVFFLAGM